MSSPASFASPMSPPPFDEDLDSMSAMTANRDAAQPPTADSNTIAGSSPAANDSHPDGVMRTFLVSVARQLKDLLDVHIQLLEKQSGVQVSITGDLKIQVQAADWKPHTMKLTTDSTSLPSILRVKIDRGAERQRETIDVEDALSVSATVAQPRHKRSRENDDVEHPGDAPGAGQSNKRMRGSEAERRSSIQSHTSDPADHAPSGVEVNGDTTLETGRLLGEMGKLSKQIKWVEDCRRIADDQHTSREERWRTTSATYHDKVRSDREIHERWVVGELTRHGNLLTQVLGEVKAFHTMAQALKWETPPSLAYPVHPAPTHATNLPAFPQQQRPKSNRHDRQSQG